MSQLNKSLKEATFLDEEVFFGPVTDREKKIKEQFEKSENNKLTAEIPKITENDVSINDSLYKSFSVEDSKYDSFEDSLYEEADEKPQSAKHFTIRKTLDKLKSKRHPFYDSLEDVCSLASNMDKCSISCEIENESNVIGKQIIEDSLKVPQLLVTNKNYSVNDQIHFDEDSLAILELENTFDDSLEEINILSNVEVEEVNDLQNIASENLNVNDNRDKKFTGISRNLFDTSVEIICAKKNVDAVDAEESYDSKSKLFDSLSNSDFKDILKDSLEEVEVNNLQNIPSENMNVNDNRDKKFAGISRNLFDTSVEIICAKKNVDSVDVEELCDSKCKLFDSLSNSDFKDSLKDSLEEIEVNDLQNIASENVNVNGNRDKNFAGISRNLFDTSVVIICEKKKGNPEDTEESCDSKRTLFDSPSNSDFKDSLEESETRNTNCKVVKHNFKEVLKDSLEVSESHSINCNIIDSDALNTATQEHAQYQFVKENILDTSVQIIYEKNKCSPSCENISNSECNDVSKDSLENLKNVKNPYEQPEMKTIQNLLENHACSAANATVLASSNVSKPLTMYPSNPVKLNRMGSCLDSNANEKSKVMKESSVLTDQISVSIPSISSLQDLFTLDSCNLKFLNDNLNLDNDMKVKLNIEVTVGDKKCQIATQDIKLLSSTNMNSEKCERDLSSKVYEKSKHTYEKTPLECDNKSVLNTDEYRITKQNEEIPFFGEIPFCEEIPNCEETPNRNSVDEIDLFLNNLPEKSYVNDESITHRKKTSMLQCVDDVQKKSYASDTSLLQALDLHDFSSFLNESVIQSNDSIIPLNLCSRDQDIQKRHSSAFKTERKEKFPFLTPLDKQNFYSSQKKAFPNKVNENKTPRNLKYCSSFKENTLKKTPGTKIPVLKIDNFAVPVSSAYKVKPLSVEKQKKCHHSPYANETGKKTPVATPHKAPHFCKVRNTIFSKVPQIVPSKKYMNVQSPVANYIRNAQGCAFLKTPVSVPVLSDCMNKMHIHQQLESPYQQRQQYSPKCDVLKSIKRKT